MHSVPPPSSYFPYPSVRRFQDEFISAIFEAVNQREHVAIAAASGLGKTVGVLSATLPFVKARGLRILYVARTHKECDRAIEELKVINKLSNSVSGISIRGRSEACFHRLVSQYALDARTAMEICGELKKRRMCPFFEKFKSGRRDLDRFLANISVQPLLFSEIVEACRKLGYCAYELSKLIIGKVDVAAMSYNYLFHDEIRQTLIKSFEKPLSSCIVIMDEAHNLPDVAVSLASDEISTSTLKRADLEAKRFGLRKVQHFVACARRAVETIQESVTEDEIALPAQTLLRGIADESGTELDDFGTVLGELLEAGDSIKLSLLQKGRIPRSSVSRVANFLMRWMETSDRKNYAHIMKCQKSRGGADDEGTTSLEIICLDPAETTIPVLSEVYSSISMSGTLEPIQCYIDVIGLPQGTKGHLFDTPFLRENIKMMVCRGVSTALADRSPSMYRKLSARISEAVRSTPTNIAVFAASYDVLRGLTEAGLKSLIQKPIYVEEPDFSSNDNDRLVESFCESAREGGGVLLGVQGGRNSEGLDLPGDLLGTVVVVGVPYAKPTPRIKARIDYYEGKFANRGKEYGYNVPAVRKAAQAAGRAFRSVDDRGAVVFMDQRFAAPPCFGILPSWIRKCCTVLPDKEGLVFNELQAFYNSR